MIVLDLETTGLDPIRHSIIDIGAIDFSNINNQFQGQCQIWAGAEIDNKALEINGFLRDDIINNKLISLNELVIQFINWIEGITDKTIAGHNVDFDISFLNESAKRYSLGRNFGKRKVDQHSLVYAHILRRNLQPPLKNGLSNISGDEIMDYVGLPREPKPHKAINGAKYETEALSRLIYGTSILQEFSQFKIPDYLKY